MRLNIKSMTLATGRSGFFTTVWILFALISFGLLSSFAAQDSQLRDIHTETSDCSLSASDLIHHFSHNTHSPFESPLSPDSDRNQENDSKEEKEELENDWDETALSSFYLERIQSEKSICSSGSFVNHRVHKKTIPLFILQHCWKSFLS